MHLKPRSRNF